MTEKPALASLPWNEAYRIHGLEAVLTPGLAIYEEAVEANIAATLRALGGDANRWRPHVKTAKLEAVMRRLGECGVANFKCATTLELLVAAQSGAADVLVAYPHVGANAQRVREIATQFPPVRISVLIEDERQLQQWRGTEIGIFLDINPGMDRTGIEQTNTARIIELARQTAGCGLAFRGLHYYDGHLGGLDLPVRTKAARAGYDRLLQIVSELMRAGIAVPEVITAGTPAFPCSLTYKPFAAAEFTHRVSPGTTVYCDASALAQLPPEYGYQPAALVISRVVSRPRADIVTCDAGHKSVSADAGVPTCLVLNCPGLMPLAPSEEHLPIRVEAGAKAPEIGDILYLLPRHVCPTVNNFDYALMVRDGELTRVEEVTARGREAPLRAAAVKQTTS